MLQRRPTIEDFVDALVSELNPNFDTFVMDSQSWKTDRKEPLQGQSKDRHADSRCVTASKISSWPLNELSVFLFFFI